MKTLIINGSPHAKGNTGRAIEELVKTFAQEGVETEVLHVGNKQISGCVACMSCAKNGKCECDPNMECGWERIYQRLKMLGRLDLIQSPVQIRNFATDLEVSK